MRHLSLLCAASAALALSLGAVGAAQAAAAPTASSAVPNTTRIIHPNAATVSGDTVTAVLDLPKTGRWTTSVSLGPASALTDSAVTDSVAGPELVHPDSGTTCNDWDFYLYDVCIEVWGSGDNVTAVEGWADTYSGGWVIIYDEPDGILNGLIPAGWDDEYYQFPPGGRNFPTDDNLCAHSDYAGKTMCLEIHP